MDKIDKIMSDLDEAIIHTTEAVASLVKRGDNLEQLEEKSKMLNERGEEFRRATYPKGRWGDLRMWMDTSAKQRLSGAWQSATSFVDTYICSNLETKCLYYARGVPISDSNLLTRIELQPILVPDSLPMSSPYTNLTPIDVTV